MKILLVNSVCGVGSTGKICVDLAKLIEDQGHDCVIAYGRGNAKGYEKTYKISSSLGNKLHYIKSRLFDKHGLGSSYATRKFIKFIKEYNPDVIHLHNIHGYYLNYKILFIFLQSFKGKVVWTMHDLWAVTGHCACYIDCNKWQSQCNQCSKLGEYPKAILDNSKNNYQLKKFLFNSLSNLTIVAVSQWLKEECKKSYLKDNNIIVINNGIDFQIFQPYECSELRQSYGLNGKKVLLAVADRWVERKGFNDFLKLSTMINNDTKLIMVGLTEEQKKNLPQNIIGITRTENQKQLAELYSMADLTINFSYFETFGLVNLESLACGTPVLTYRTGGCVDIVDNDVGYIIDQGDLKCAKQIIEQHKKDKNIIESCLNKAKKYEKQAKYIEYLNIYKN